MVKNIQDGCQLYKDAKTQFIEVKRTFDEVGAIGKEVGGFIGKLFGFFKKPAPVAQKKERFVAVDETQVKIDIVKNLTEFFKLQEQLAAHIREEEQKSLTVYDPDQNHMEAALKRVMAQQEMASRGQERQAFQRQQAMQNNPENSPTIFQQKDAELAQARAALQQQQHEQAMQQQAMQAQNQSLQSQQDHQQTLDQQAAAPQPQQPAAPTEGQQ